MTPLPSGIDATATPLEATTSATVEITTAGEIRVRPSRMMMLSPPGAAAPRFAIDPAARAAGELDRSSAPRYRDRGGGLARACLGSRVLPRRSTRLTLSAPTIAPRGCR